MRTAEGAFEVAVPQVRGAGEPFRSSLMGFLDGNSEVLERLVGEMYARGLSLRCSWVEEQLAEQRMRRGNHSHPARQHQPKMLQSLAITPGVGKTHLAVALAVSAAEPGIPSISPTSMI